MSGSSSHLDSIVAARVAEAMGIDPPIAERALALLGEGKAVPYLARYRRIDVGGLDERALRAMRNLAEHAREIEQRREFILAAIREREGVPEKLRKRIERCRDRTELEYLYEPHRPPRKTPGRLARDMGLDPLADAYLGNEAPDGSAFVDPAKGVGSAEEALRGAREILAERFAVDPEVRGAALRALEKEGTIGGVPVPGRENLPQRLRGLVASEERLGRIPSHRLLALRRAEREGMLTIRATLPDERVVAAIEQRFLPKEAKPEVKAFLDQAAAAAVRLLKPAVLEDGMRRARLRSEEEAIGVYAQNLHDLLLFPPAGARRVLGIDPAPRGPVPFACVDERGNHLESARLRPFDKDEAKRAEAREALLRLVQTHAIEAIALGNGQGRHEVEAFLRETLEPLGDGLPPVVIVSESGIGAYASGPVGRGELQPLAVPVRGAVSLARRLIDPMAELVKLDPRQAAAGQFQEEIEPGHLSRALRDAVESCVNRVGVDVNRAPAAQLANVCGFTPSAARALADHREAHGPFRSREAVRALPFITANAFEQAGGFLRVFGGEDPLDATGVHPDHAPVVRRIAEKTGRAPADLIGNADLLADLVAEDFADERCPPATVAAVILELLESGKDPRPPLELVRRPAGVRSTSDLAPGLQLPGRVTNVTNFGAFVDVGVQQDGLVHVSELADHFVKDPTTVVHVGQTVQVRVLGVDGESGRISLSMKSGVGRGEGAERRPRGDGERTDEGRGGAARRPRRPSDRRPDERRPRRDRPRRDEEPREREEVEAPLVEAPVAPAPPEDRPPERELTEEEFVKQRLEEIRRRFG